MASTAYYETVKLCSACREKKPIGEFPKNRSMKDGLLNQCKVCQRKSTKKHYEKHKRRYLKKMREYKDEMLSNGLCASGCGAPLHWSNRTYCIEHASYRSKYNGHGISLDGRLILYARQNGECAICHKFFEDPMDLGIDHDHENGNVRGLLCIRCNAGIGNLNDSVDDIRSALNYFEERGYGVNSIL